MIHYAFYDVDETIIHEKSMFTVLREISKRIPSIRPDEINAGLQKMRSAGDDRAVVNRQFYRALKGLRQQEVREIAQSYMDGRLSGSEAFLIEPVVSELEALRSKGYVPVFVSGSAVDFILPLARHLAVEHCLATRLSVDAEGRYTGEIAGHSMIGQGKRTAVLDFLSDHAGDPAACAGFGDHISDLSFLELVGQPHVVGAHDAALNDIASKRGWPTLPH